MLSVSWWFPCMALTPRANSSCTFLPCRVWNGIFATGDWRAKKGLEDDVPTQRLEIGDCHAREMAAKAAVRTENLIRV